MKQKKRSQKSRLVGRRVDVARYRIFSFIAILILLGLLLAVALAPLALS